MQLLLNQFWGCCWLAGPALPLLRVATNLFHSVKGHLQDVDLLSAVGLEYGALLRMLLLPVREYCARAATGTFQGMSHLISLHLSLRPNLQLSPNQWSAPSIRLQYRPLHGLKA